MKYSENDVVNLYYDEINAPTVSITRLCNIIKNNPPVLRPAEDYDEEAKKILSREGFELYPTVKKTTLIYDPGTEYYFKILHPLNLKSRIGYYLTDKPGTIYGLSQELISRGIKVPRVTAYGTLKNGGRPFFAMEKIEGKSLSDILIKEKRKRPLSEYRKVIDQMVKFHSMGYWLGDAHLAHIFIKDEEVSGFIDIDSIRRNRPYMLKNLAKDIAGLNHPGLPLSSEEKMSLLNYCLDIEKINNKKKFLRLVDLCMKRRWKEYSR